MEGRGSILMHCGSVINTATNGPLTPSHPHTHQDVNTDKDASVQPRISTISCHHIKIVLRHRLTINLLSGVTTDLT